MTNPIMSALVEIQAAERIEAENLRSAELKKIDEVKRRQAEELFALHAAADAADIAVRQAEERLAAAISASRAAHAARNQLDLSLEVSLNRARFRLAELSDPRIDILLERLGDLFEESRHGLNVWHEKIPTFAGSMRVERGNFAECNAAIGAIRCARNELEALKYAPLPDDFESTIREIFAPVEVALRPLGIRTDLGPLIAPDGNSAHEGWLKKFTNLITRGNQSHVAYLR